MDCKKCTCGLGPRSLQCVLLIGRAVGVEKLLSTSSQESLSFFTGDQRRRDRWRSRWSTSRLILPFDRNDINSLYGHDFDRREKEAGTRCWSQGGRRRIAGAAQASQS